MSGITTVVDGVEMRSRLEARWAHFFTRIGWRWTYEPFDADGYIPDFIIHGAAPLLIEVKPAVTPADYTQAVTKVQSAGLSHDVLIIGVTWQAPPLDGAWDNPVAGWMGEAHEAGHEWASGVWFGCSSCGGTSVHHATMWYGGRPCGCADGDHHLGFADTELLRSAWADACNETKWRRR